MKIKLLILLLATLSIIPVSQAFGENISNPHLKKLYEDTGLIPTEPYLVRYTILSFGNSIKCGGDHFCSIQEQENWIKILFNKWKTHLPNVEFEYIRGANAEDAMVLIEIVGCKDIPPLITSEIHRSGSGCGAGDGPNTRGYAATTGGSLYFGTKPPFDGQIYFNAGATLLHEIGHALGLNHIGAGGCVMSSFGTTTTFCLAEKNAIKLLWKDAVCAIPQCLPLGTPVEADTAIRNIQFNPDPIFQGNKTLITCEVVNRGNINVESTLFFHDVTDGRVIHFSFLPEIIEVGDINQCLGFGFSDIIWDTKTASIGVHDMRFYLSPHEDELLTADNRIDLSVEVLDPNTPPPPPPPNNPPVANNDSYITDEGVDLVVNNINGVLANDVDADGDPLTASLVVDPANGLLSFNTNGSFIYTPNIGFFGVDSFDYIANDGKDDSNVAIVTITVNEVVPPPPPPPDPIKDKLEEIKQALTELQRLIGELEVLINSTS